MKITVAESNPSTGLLAQQPFCFSPDVLARDNLVLIMTTSLTSERVLARDHVHDHATRKKGEVRELVPRF